MNLMRAATVLLALAAQENTKRENDWHFRGGIDGDGSWSGAKEIEKGLTTAPLEKAKALVVLITTEEQWVRLWKSAWNSDREAKPVAIDFKTHVVVYARPTYYFHGAFRLGKPAVEEGVLSAELVKEACPEKFEKVGHTGFLAKAVERKGITTIRVTAGEEKAEVAVEGK